MIPSALAPSFVVRGPANRGGVRVLGATSKSRAVQQTDFQTADNRFRIGNRHW